MLCDGLPVVEPTEGGLEDRPQPAVETGHWGSGRPEFGRDYAESETSKAGEQIEAAGCRYGGVVVCSSSTGPAA
jgi:hypothetical protein